MATNDGSGRTEARLSEAGCLQFGDCECGLGVGETPHRLMDRHKLTTERDAVSTGTLEAAKAQRNDNVGKLRVRRLIPIRTLATVLAPQEEVITAFSLPSGRNVDAHVGGMIEEDCQGEGRQLTIAQAYLDIAKFDEEERAQCTVWCVGKEVHSRK